MRNYVYQNHITLQLKPFKKIIYNYYVTIPQKYIVLLNKLPRQKINELYYIYKWIENWSSIR